MTFASDRGGNAFQLVAEPLVELGDGVQPVSNVCQQRIFRHRQPRAEFTVAEIAYRAKHAPQIYASDFSTRGEQGYFVLDILSGGAIALPAWFPIARPAAVAAIFSAGASGFGRPRRVVFDAGPFHLDCVADLHD
ncbi:MAG TPA: hypothetical protein VEZ51_06460 [Gemmatimonadaceae bacterium]|nr:hypothetical protein [Gemmatimonadaceae bacterium]